MDRADVHYTAAWVVLYFFFPILVLFCWWAVPQLLSSNKEQDANVSPFKPAGVRQLCFCVEEEITVVGWVKAQICFSHPEIDKRIILIPQKRKMTEFFGIVILLWNVGVYHIIPKKVNESEAPGRGRTEHHCAEQLTGVFQHSFQISVSCPGKAAITWISQRGNNSNNMTS